MFGIGIRWGDLGSRSGTTKLSGTFGGIFLSRGLRRDSCGR